MKNERRTLINESWVLTGKMHTIKRMVLLAVCLLVLGSTQPILADITNGDFSADPPLWGWTVSDETFVYEYGDRAFLTVEEWSSSTLSQDEIKLESSDKWLSFEFEMIGGSDETDEFTAAFGPSGTSPNPFYIFRSDDPRFDGDSYLETVTFPLTDLDTGPSHKYKLLFTLTNIHPDDTTSSVAIDNVRLSPVPVPGAVVLGSLGLSFSGWLLRRRRASH
jgi:hypothetical protein